MLKKELESFKQYLHKIENYPKKGFKAQFEQYCEFLEFLNEIISILKNKHLFSY